MFQKTITYFSIVIIVIGFIFLANGLILATPPTQDPPGGNVPAPLNVGLIGQYKSGGLILNTGGATTGLIVSQGNVGIGTAGPGAKLDVRGSLYSSGNYDINNTWPMVYFRDTDHRSAMVHVNSNIFYILRGSGVNSAGWEAYGGYWPLTINLENNDATFGGSLSVPRGNLSVGGSIYGWNVPSDVKETSATHNGNFGGYKAMYDWIQSNGCSGYHVCDATELTRYSQRSTAQFYGWYNSGVFISAY